MKSKTPEYRAWQDMKQRCFNKNHKSFLHYGGRGILVCERWINSFENFLEDIGKRPENHSLDRIDVDLGYYPENCRWATSSQQSRNLRVHKKEDVGISLGYGGMVWDAYIAVNGKSYRIGSFKDKKRAIEARKQAEIDYWESGVEPPKFEGLQRNNKSGVKGICFNTHHQSWDVYTYIGKKKKDIGRFKSFDDAVKARANFTTT